MIIIVLAALLVASLIAIVRLWHGLRFWKMIAQESQTSTTYWHQKYMAQIAPDPCQRTGQRSPVSVIREGPARWFDVEGEARGGYR